MKKILLGLLIIICMLSVSGQDSSVKVIFTKISGAEDNLDFENLNIDEELNFAEIGKQRSGDLKRSTTIIKKSTKKIDTIYHYSRKDLSFIGADLNFKSCVFELDILAMLRYSDNDTSKQVLTQFGGQVVFEDCQFLEAVDFSQTEFAKAVKFVGCTFHKALNTSAVTVNQELSFSNCVFNNPCFFNNMNIKAKCSIIDCQFLNELSFVSSLFNQEPELTGSKFRRLLLKNCRVGENPFFWSFEDKPEYQKFLPQVEYDKAFYGTKIEHSKNMTIHTSRSNWDGKELTKEIVNLWDARITIKTDHEKGSYKVLGRVVLDKNKNILMVDHGKLEAPNGTILVADKKLEIDIDRPSDYKIITI